MIVLDTHAWIWLVSAPASLSEPAARALAKSKRPAIAAISCFELAALASRGRISLDRPPLEWIEASLQKHAIELLPLTPAVAVRATQLGAAFPRDPADRQIVATALIHGARLVTRDEPIRNAAAVDTIW